MKKKKIKEKFKSFKINDKSSYTTIKTTLKSVVKDFKIQPQIEILVKDMNDLIIHTYQFIRLYILHLYTLSIPFPEINETFIKYCIKTLGTRDNRGAKSRDIKLLETLDEFYHQEYQPLLNHQTSSNWGNNWFIYSLKFSAQVLPYISKLLVTWSITDCLSPNTATFSKSNNAETDLFKLLNCISIKRYA